jgi:hypothetical protein
MENYGDLVKIGTLHCPTHCSVDLDHNTVCKRTNGFGNLDWALVHLESPRFRKPNSIWLQKVDGSERELIAASVGRAMPPEGSEVLIITGSRGVVRGTSLVSTAILNLGRCCSAAPAWAVCVSHIRKHNDLCCVRP